MGATCSISLRASKLHSSRVGTTRKREREEGTGWREERRSERLNRRRRVPRSLARSPPSSAAKLNSNPLSHRRRRRRLQQRRHPRRTMLLCTIEKKSRKFQGFTAGRSSLSPMAGCSTIRQLRVVLPGAPCMLLPFFIRRACRVVSESRSVICMMRWKGEGMAKAEGEERKGLNDWFGRIRNSIKG